jgi:Raf kinase inhibitor-like YbhB/YbcL family protein
LSAGISYNGIDLNQFLVSPSRLTEKPMKLESSAFCDGDRIPAEHTADGSDFSPELCWTDVPQGARSLALICDDPDAPSRRKPAAEPWVHWIIFNVPAESCRLPTAIERIAEPTNIPGALQGVNSWPLRNMGYRGPAPPAGSGTHRYFFRLYALDEMLPLEAGVGKQRLLRAMAGHVLAECQLVGTYER